MATLTLIYETSILYNDKNLTNVIEFNHEYDEEEFYTDEDTEEEFEMKQAKQEIELKNKALKLSYDKFLKDFSWTLSFEEFEKNQPTMKLIKFEDTNF
jgi:hypothetical protein